MAKMTFKLPEETIRKMEALGSHYDAVTSAVLEEGVKPLYDAAKQSLSSVIGQGTKEPWESTGDLLDSLSVTKPYQSASGAGAGLYNGYNVFYFAPERGGFRRTP